MIASAVQRIWEAHRLQPHRVRSFKRSSDPAFAEKVEDIVGLYMSPPAHAVVLSIDEKSHGWMAPGWQGKSADEGGWLAVMCPACSRGAQGRWP